MVTLRVVVLSLVLFALSVDANVSFNDLSSTDSPFLKVGTGGWTAGACWSESAGASFAVATKACQGVADATTTLSYPSAVNNVFATNGNAYACVTAQFGTLTGPDILYVGVAGSTATINLATGTTGPVTVGGQFTLTTTTVTPTLTLNSAAGNPATTLTSFKIHPVLLVNAAFTSPTYVAGGLSTPIGGYQFLGGQTPVSDSIALGGGQAVTGAFSGSTTTTPITYGFTPSSAWAAGSDGATYTVTLTDSASYQPPATPGPCTAGAQTLTAKVQVNVVMVTAITSSASPSNVDLLATDSVLVEKFGGTGSYGVTATGSTDTKNCQWTDTTVTASAATGATFTTGTVAGNLGQLTVKCPGTGSGSSVTYTAGPYSIKIVQMGTISVTSTTGGYVTATNKLITGTGSNPAISITKPATSDTSQISFNKGTSAGSFSSNPATGAGPFTTTISTLTSADDTKTFTASAQYVGASKTASAVVDSVTITIVYLSISTFTDTTANSQQSGNCPAGYSSPCVVASASSPTIVFNTAGTGFDTQGIVVGATLNAGGTGSPAGSTQSVTFTATQDKSSIFSRVSNSGASTFTINSNDPGSSATNKQYTLAFISITAGGLQVTSSNTNAGKLSCVLSPSTTTCTFQLAGTAFNTVDIVETGGSNLAQTGISATPGSSINTKASAAAAEDGSTFTVKAYINGVTGFVETSAQSVNLYYLSVTAFQTQVAPTAVLSGTTNYVYFAPNANILTLKTVGTGFDTVVYSGFSGGTTVTDNGATLSGSAPNRVATSGSKTYTVVLADDNKAVSLTISNSVGSAATTYAVPTTSYSITLIFTKANAGTGTAGGIFATGAGASNAGSFTTGQACIATVSAATCSYKITGNSFNSFTYTASNAGTNVKGTSTGSAAPAIGASTGTFTTPSLTTAEDGATISATVFEAASAAYTTQPTDTTAASQLFFLSVSSFETNTVPTAFNNGGKYYVVLNPSTNLQLQTKGTGFNTVSYTATAGTLNAKPQGQSAGTTGGTESAWFTTVGSTRTASTPTPALTITGLSPKDNGAVVSTTVSNQAVSSSVTYTPTNSLTIVYLSQTTYTVTDGSPAVPDTACYATPSSTCTFTLVGTGFDTVAYTSSATGTTAKGTISMGSPVSWTPTLTYKDTTSTAATPVTMTYTATYSPQPPTQLTITGSLNVFFVSDIDSTGKRSSPVTNSKATPNTLNLFAAGDITTTSPSPVLSGVGTTFTNAQLQVKPFGSGAFTNVPGTYPACTVTNPGTNTATYSCPMIPAGQNGFNPADDQAQFQVVLLNSGNAAITYTTLPITVTVFGFKTDPPTSLIGFTTVRSTVPYTPPTTNFVTYTYVLVPANGAGSNIPTSQTWSNASPTDPRNAVMPSTTSALAANAVINFLVSANAALSSTPNSPWAAGGTFVAKNADSYTITLGLAGVSTFRQTSFQLITFSYFSGTGTQPNANGDYLYDYYLGYNGPQTTYVPPNPEPSYTINVKADHLAPLDKTGAIISPNTNTCTLTVTPGTAGLVGPTLTQTSATTDSITFLVDCTQSTDPSAANCVYNQVEKLNGATLSVACSGPAVYTGSSPSPYGPSVPLVIKYPAKMALTPTAVWTSTPTGFCAGYTGQYPEPGHWDYDQPLTVNFNWLKLGNPQVTTIKQVMSWDIHTGSSSGTALNIAAAGGFPGAPAVFDGANPIAYQVSSGTPLTVSQARDIYFNNFLTVTAKFTGTGGTPLLSPFTITFQPLDFTKDNGILQPHFPPVLLTTPALLQPQYNNFADVGGFVWQPPALGFIVKDGFPKHDSPFGNSKYSTTAIPVFPNRNYDQILETRVTVAFSQKFAATSPTTYDNKYQYFTSVAANLASAPGTVSFTDPKAGVVTGAYTNGITGVYAVTSNISPPNGPLWTYNKWIYRWILGVYKVSGQYEPYIVPTAGVFDPAALTYKYHAASTGFEGIWNWYPREFTPSLCPSVPTGNPFDIGTTNAVVVPTTTAAMYPAPDAGVLSWAYSHQTAGPSFRIDSTLTSGLLSGAQNANTALLPAVSTVTHTFNSQYTITTQVASATADAFGPQSTEILGYTVIATGQISSIVSADANSIITARYTHTLPFYLLRAPDGNPTTSGQRTVVGYPTVVTVKNCKSITTLTSGTPYTVASHRAGETFVVSLSSITAGGTFTVTIVDATPGTMDTAQTVISTTVTAGSTPVFRFTVGYNLAGVPLTKSSIQYSGITGTVQLSYHEFSSIPANWPFANDPTGAAITGYASNEAVKTCVGQQVSASTVSGTTFGVPAAAQYFGCGTTNQVTSPAC